MTPMLEQALAVIKKQGAMRTSALALALRFEGSDEDLDELLRPCIASGQLVACGVTVGPDELRTIEYRTSVNAGGRTQADWIPHRSKAERARDQEAARRRNHNHLFLKPERTYGADQPSDVTATLARVAGVSVPALAHAESRENPPVNLVERIKAAFEKHGPMTVPQLRAHVDHPHMPTTLSQLAERGTLARLGGGKRSTIWGLPGQKTPAAATPDALERGAELGRVKKPKQAKRAGEGSVAMRRKRMKRTSRISAAVAKAAGIKAAKTRAENAARAAAVAFRPAIAADGALLLMGAQTAGELSRSEARVLIDFIRRLDKAEIVA
jgi:hypothetical protein